MGENAIRGDTRTPRLGRLGLALAGTPTITAAARPTATTVNKELRFT